MRARRSLSSALVATGIVNGRIVSALVTDMSVSSAGAVGSDDDVKPCRSRPRTAPGRHPGIAPRSYSRVVSRASQPTSRVISAATANDRIDADIQLCGLKPMSRPNDVHAEAHQDT